MKITRRLKLFLVFFSAFIGWVCLAPSLAEHLIVEKPLEKADAILVLGGSSTYVERTHKAAELFKQGIAPKIFLTNDGEQGGWDRREQRNPYFVERARWELINQGVAESAIEILPGIVRGTQDEAVLLEKTLAEKPLKSLLIVTSPYHTRRAFSAFASILHEKADAPEIGIVSPAPGEQSPPPAVWWLSVRGWRFVAGEYLKFVYYWMFY